MEWEEDGLVERVRAAGCSVLLDGADCLIPSRYLRTALLELSERRVIGMEGFFYEPDTGAIVPDMGSIADFSNADQSSSDTSALKVAEMWEGKPIFIEVSLAAATLVWLQMAPNTGAPAGLAPKRWT